MASPPPIDQSELLTVTQADRDDNFNGDTALLVRSIDALLSLDDANALVPHGLGGKGSHAYRLLCAARHRLAALSTPAPAVEGIADVLSRKWLDPECVEGGCQSLVWKGRYEAAVQGRADFRDAYRRERSFPTTPPESVTGAREAALEECHGLDTPERVCFYEQDFYVLSNFSAFNVRWGPYTFPTSEHCYHWRRFFLAGGYDADKLCDQIMHAPSAHEAFRIAQANKVYQVDHWDDVKIGEMREILRLKAAQHEYVHRKLLATGDRELVENSWRDDYWGWGPNRDGQNMLGKLWMEVRAELRTTVTPAPSAPKGVKS